MLQGKDTTVACCGLRCWPCRLPVSRVRLKDGMDCCTTRAEQSYGLVVDISLFVPSTTAVVFGTDGLSICMSSGCMKTLSSAFWPHRRCATVGSRTSILPRSASPNKRFAPKVARPTDESFMGGCLWIKGWSFCLLVSVFASVIVSDEFEEWRVLTWW